MSSGNTKNSSLNSFDARHTLKVGDDTYQIYRLDAVKGTDKLPYSLKVLAENLLRTEDGANIGPDLTGSQRANPEYVLAKVLDPNAVVPHDYQVTFVTTTSGRVVAGIVKAETDKVLTLQTQNEVVRLPKSDVEERRLSSLSMMPEGLLTQLKDAEVRDLLAYLAGPGQVALPTPP